MRGAARIRTGDGGFAIRCLSHLATAPDSVGNPMCIGSDRARLEPTEDQTWLSNGLRQSGPSADVYMTLARILLTSRDVVKVGRQGNVDGSIHSVALTTAKSPAGCQVAPASVAIRQFPD